MRPKTYSKKQHEIEIDYIDSKALYILEKLRAANHIAYLVGGSVRDLLLKKNPKDFDISTSAKPNEIKVLFPRVILIGKRFCLAHIYFGRKAMEVSTFRAGDITNEQLITEDNIWGSPEEDAIRRDFTINGLFYDSKRELVIDYVKGYPDIRRRLLRAIGIPFLRFKQDPVRMIRCLKFKARFGFDIDEETRLALTECKGEIVKSSSARVLEELFRMLESGSAQKFFKLMVDYGMMQYLIPTIAEFLETNEGYLIYAYLKEVDKILSESNPPHLQRPLLLSCLIFPLLDKRLKLRFTNEEKGASLNHIRHECNLVMDDIFSACLRTPKRLRIKTEELLISQYRITPLQKKKSSRIHIPSIPEFNLAIQFFNLRCHIEPTMKELLEKWVKAYKQAMNKEALHCREKKASIIKI